MSAPPFSFSIPEPEPCQRLTRPPLVPSSSDTPSVCQPAASAPCSLRPSPEAGVPAKLPLVFVYLNMLMILVLVHFFTAHGKTIGSQVSDRSPLGFPRGSIRLLLIAGYLGMAAYLYKTQPEFENPPHAAYALPMALLLSGYLIGHVLTGFLTKIGGGTTPAWFQDFEAWISLLAVVGLGIIVIVRLVINTSLPMEDRLDIQMLETILAAVVGFYFGARS